MSAERRPPAVTLACVFIGVSGLLLLVNLISALTSWGSLELQEAVQSELDSGLLGDQDLSLATALEVLRYALLVLVVVAIAATVLAFATARGDRAARLVLTVLCGLGAVVFALSGFVGLLPAIFLAGSAFVLWSPESRVWFDVTNDRTPSPELLAKVATRAEERRASPELPPVYPGASAHGFDRPERRAVPSSVTTAAVTMLVSSLLVGSAVAVNVLMYLVRLADPSEYAVIFGDQPPPAETLYSLGDSERTVVLVVAVSTVLAVLSLLGFLVAIGLLLNRPRWRVPALVLSYVGLLGAATTVPLALPVAIAALVTIVLLRRRESREWSGHR
ncbi:Tat pathway signal sequence domain protein [Aeromicrobium marinum DSM 15272]|uniref:Tat pathway signal sequence domain protein n=1 Tax=Aeromicrobium marinum DSM 15272 TaxID=585531 RepID=E2SFB4_9ACTN|nr:hypothetical protein [Aeromicrobium marinum]EFQ82199.1 Tat pathway signal sequence domain protein [Aeromicrobium marinum DSM 15272]